MLFLSEIRAQPGKRLEGKCNGAVTLLPRIRHRTDGIWAGAAAFGAGCNVDGPRAILWRVMILWPVDGTEGGRREKQNPVNRKLVGCDASRSTDFGAEYVASASRFVRFSNLGFWTSPRIACSQRKCLPWKWFFQDYRCRQSFAASIARAAGTRTLSLSALAHQSAAPFVAVQERRKVLVG